ncbi:MAG: glycoside hydrolase family 88 protein [Clostridiales bacterium]|jgi:unsaturated rhamnogalacturonyl hydrolase|nr:glycoside hydrolase family 88 protein [Clostridiales bacterium]
MRKINEKTERLINAYIDGVLKNSTPDRPAWNAERLRDGKPPAWNYIDGVFITGLLCLYGQTGRRELLDFADAFTDYYIAGDGSILGYDPREYNLDNIGFGSALFDLFRLSGREKYRKAIDLLYAQIEAQPRAATGSFWHKKIYPDQVWLDGLYMGQVFYTRFETEYNGCANYGDILLQFENARRYMFDERKKLYYHACDFSKKAFWADPETGLSKGFWLRATGWYVTALADIIGYADPREGAFTARLSALLAEAVGGILACIDPKTKMFFQAPDQGGRDGNYLETSGSAMVAYAVMKAARLGVIPVGYADAGADIFNGICGRRLAERDGRPRLSGICLSAGLGPENNRRRDGTFEYYVSEPVVEDDAKGAGPFLMAYAEMKKAEYG